MRDSECVDFSNEEVVTSSSFAKGKTRRGKRAGRHQKQRVSTDDDSSIEAARRSADGDSLSSSLRPSLEGSRVRNTPVSCHQPHACHVGWDFMAQRYAQCTSVAVCREVSHTCAETTKENIIVISSVG